MGLESYRFDVIFKEKLPKEQIIPLFCKIGLTYLGDYESFWRSIESSESYFFELRTEKGLTEIHVLLSKDETFLDRFSLRFSVASPSSVIDQTFELLEKLDKETPIFLRDTEIINHLWRKDVKAGKREAMFYVSGGANEDANLEKKAFIPIDVKLFKENKLGIAKRQIVLDNKQGAIIEGNNTIGHFENSGIEGKLLNIIKTEM